MGRRNEDDRDREMAGGCRVPKVSCFCADLEAKVATFKFKSEYKLYVAI